jgi:pSer/pThr/pTyr-binding forkhead associated (FHA) protein
MKVSLIVQTPGKMRGKPIPITLPQFLIGRDSHCQLRPASPVVSNRHCAIVIRGNEVYVHDFESTNGTFVNGDRIRAEIKLHDKDRLRIGQLEFDVSIEAPLAVDQQTPVPPAKPSMAPDDDAAAALLLALRDESAEGSSEATKVDSQGVPTGTTIMEMSAPGTAAPADDKKEDKEEANKDKKAKPTQQGDTATAANQLLQKYLRRPRK